MGKTIEELFQTKKLQSSGQTAEKTYDIRNSKDIPITSNAPEMSLVLSAASSIRKTLGFRTKETLLEEEFGGLRPLRLLASPILYGSDIVRLTTRKTNDVQAMKDSINTNGPKGGNNGLLGKVLKKVEGFVTKTLGLPQDTYPTYVIGTGKLQSGKEPDTMITLAEIKKDAAGSSFGKFLKQTGGGTPSQLAKQIIGGGLKVTQGAIRTALFGSQTVADKAKGNDNSFVGKYASTAAYASTMSKYTEKLAVNYLDITLVSPVGGFKRNGEIYGRDLGSKSYGMRLNGRMGEPTSAFLQDNRYWISDKYTTFDPTSRTKGLPNRESAELVVSSKFLNPRFLGATYALNSPAGGITVTDGKFGSTEYSFSLSDGTRNKKFGEPTLKDVPKIYTNVNPYSPYGSKSGPSTVFDPRVEVDPKLGSKMLINLPWEMNSPAGGIVTTDGIFGKNTEFAFSLSDNSNHKKFGEPTIDGLKYIYTDINPYFNGGINEGPSTAPNPFIQESVLGSKMLINLPWELNSPLSGLQRPDGVFGLGKYAFRLSDNDINKKKGEPTQDELLLYNTPDTPYYDGLEAGPGLVSEILLNPILKFIQPKKRGDGHRYSQKANASKIVTGTSNITNSLSAKRGLKSLSDVINQTGVFTAGELSTIKYNGETIDKVDLIPLRFTSMTNGESIYMRTIVSGFNETFSPSWDSSKMIGSPFNFYNYTGVERKITFNLKAYAMSQVELMMMWRKIEFLAKFNYPGGYTDTGFVLANLMKFTFGDLYHNRVCFLDSLTYSIEDNENLWELGEGNAKVVVSDAYDSQFEFDGRFTPYEGGSTLNFGSTAEIEVRGSKTEGIRKGENRVYDPITNQGFIEDISSTAKDRSRTVSTQSMSNFRLPKFINISVGLTFIESRNTTNRLYDFGTPLSNDTAPKPSAATGDGNKQNNAASKNAGGATKPSPAPAKDIQKKIKGTNVPDGTKQANGGFGG